MALSCPSFTSFCFTRLLLLRPASSARRIRFDDNLGPIRCQIFQSPTRIMSSGIVTRPRLLFIGWLPSCARRQFVAIKLPANALVFKGLFRTRFSTRIMSAKPLSFGQLLGSGPNFREQNPTLSCSISMAANSRLEGFRVETELTKAVA
jgi:hypothetical protein